MYPLKLYLIVMAISCSLYSCNENDTSEGNIIGEIPFTVITQGDIHGSVEKGLDDINLVITNSDGWNGLIKKMDEKMYNINFSEKDIDFSKYQIIAVFDEQHGNGGWSINITEILEYSNKIFASVCNLKTGNATSVITNPYHIVKIPRSVKRVEFSRK